MEGDRMEHYLIVRFRKDADVKKLYEEISELFADAGSIEGVRKAEVFLSSGKLRNSYDMMIKVTMKKSSLPLFEDSDLYRRWQTDYSDHISRIKEFDS